MQVFKNDDIYDFILSNNEITIINKYAIYDILAYFKKNGIDIDLYHCDGYINCVIRYYSIILNKYITVYSRTSLHEMFLKNFDYYIKILLSDLDRYIFNSKKCIIALNKDLPYKNYIINKNNERIYS